MSGVDIRRLLIIRRRIYTLVAKGSVGPEGLQINFEWCEGLMKVEALFALHIEGLNIEKPPFFHSDLNHLNFTIIEHHLDEIQYS